MRRGDARFGPLRMGSETIVATEGQCILMREGPTNRYTANSMCSKTPRHLGGAPKRGAVVHDRETTQPAVSPTIATDERGSDYRYGSAAVRLEVGVGVTTDTTTFSSYELWCRLEF